MGDINMVRMLDYYEFEQIGEIAMPASVREHMLGYFKKLRTSNPKLMELMIEIALTKRDSQFISLRGVEYAFGFSNSAYSRDGSEEKCFIFSKCSVGDFLRKIGGFDAVTT